MTSISLYFGKHNHWINQYQANVYLVFDTQVIYLKLGL